MREGVGEALHVDKRSYYTSTGHSHFISRGMRERSCRHRGRAPETERGYLMIPGPSVIKPLATRLTKPKTGSS